MFKRVVDDDINLCLVHESFAVRYFELVTENIEYFSQWLDWPRFCTTEQGFKDFVTRSLHGYAEGKSLNLAVEYRGDIVGNCGFHTINRKTQVAEVGYWLAPQYQGNGIMTRSCQYLIQWAFAELNIEKGWIRIINA